MIVGWGLTIESASGLTIEGASGLSIESAAFMTYTLEFFAGAKDGDAERFVRSTQVTTNASGIALFDVPLPDAEQAGEFLTATATDPTTDQILTRARGRFW